MSECVIKLDDQLLLAPVGIDLVRDLLADLVTRYEGLFTFSDPHYPDGQPELLFKVLVDGYALNKCDGVIGLEVIDLRAARVDAKTSPDPKWKDRHAGRVLASEFARTINCS